MPQDFFLVSPLHLYYSTQIRMYSLSILLVLIVYFCLLKFPKYYSIAVIAGLYTHYLFIPFVISLSIIFPKLIKKNLFAFACFAPWLLFAFTCPHPQPWNFPFYISWPSSVLALTVGGVGATTLRTFFGSHPSLILRVFSLFISLWVFKNFIRSQGKMKLVVLTHFILTLILLSPRSLILISPLYLTLVASRLSTVKGILLGVSFVLIHIGFNIMLPSYWANLTSLTTTINSLPPGSAVIHENPYTYFSALSSTSVPQLLIGHSGLSTVTEELLNVTSIPSLHTSLTYPNVFVVKVDLLTLPATISFNSL